MPAGWMNRSNHLEIVLPALENVMIRPQATVEQHAPRTAWSMRSLVSSMRILNEQKSGNLLESCSKDSTRMSRRVRRSILSLNRMKRPSLNTGRLERNATTNLAGRNRNLSVLSAVGLKMRSNNKRKES